MCILVFLFPVQFADPVAQEHQTVNPLHLYPNLQQLYIFEAEKKQLDSFCNEKYNICWISLSFINECHNSQTSADNCVTETAHFSFFLFFIIYERCEVVIPIELNPPFSEYVLHFPKRWDIQKDTHWLER